MALAQTLGKNIRRLRQDQGLSQEELAERAELHPTYVSGVEGGRRNPTVGVVEKFAAALEVDPSMLLATDD